MSKDSDIIRDVYQNAVEEAENVQRYLENTLSDLEKLAATLDKIVERCEWTLNVPQFRGELGQPLAEAVLRIATRSNE